ncbi:hypothetical protein GCM10028794_24090 [Silanimonas algicola]
MATKPLDRLMFAQGGKCFFCARVLPKSEASIEHLVPSSRGGANSDDNCVACCKSINALLGSMSLKEKLRVVLNQRGDFICPNAQAMDSDSKDEAPTTPTAKKSDSAPKAPTPPKAKPDNYTIVLNDLKKRAASRPRKVETLKSTIRATIKSAKSTITEAQLDTLIKHLAVNGKVVIDGEKVNYSL